MFKYLITIPIDSLNHIDAPTVLEEMCEEINEEFYPLIIKLVDVDEVVAGNTVEEYECIKIIKFETEIDFLDFNTFLRRRFRLLKVKDWEAFDQWA